MSSRTIASGSLAGRRRCVLWRGLSMPSCSAVTKRILLSGRTSPVSRSPTARHSESLACKNSSQSFSKVGVSPRPCNNLNITSRRPGDVVTRSVLNSLSEFIQRDSMSSLVLAIVLNGWPVPALK